ncbi:MAG: hypothetical protein QG577_2871, partial [Thermodesulfobacteriota bacterium]|nr:hypothetical protein [Thermodesulfobacteriota bacterium]
DYGLLDDFRSGRDRFFESRGEPGSVPHPCSAGCPGFANQDQDIDEPKSRPIGCSIDPHTCTEDTSATTFIPRPAQACGVMGQADVAREPMELRQPDGQCPVSTVTDCPRQEAAHHNSAHAAAQPRPCSPEMQSNVNAEPQSSWQPREPEPETNVASVTDPIINPDDLSVTKKDSSSWSKLKDHALVSKSGRMLSNMLAVSKEFVQTRRRVVLPAAAAVLLVMAFLYLANPKPYTVETRLMFISGDGRNPDSQGWSLDRETKYFNNTNIVYALSQRLFEGQGGPSALPGNQKSLSKSGKVVGDGRDTFKNPGEFIKWFVQASSREADSNAVPGKITLKLTGKDPKFLKAVSENYVRSYVDFRRTIQPAVVQEPQSGSVTEVASAPPVLKTLNERIQTFDIQEREYELALNLLDSGKSPFSGFLPKDHMVDANSLGHFQQKIVQLELARNSLRLKYAPDSREVRTVEAEIQAARKSMRQCVVEQLRFVKHNKELLLTQKMELEKGVITPSGVKPQQPNNPGPTKQFVGTDAPVFLGDGLYLIWDYPSLSEKPLLSRVGDVKDRLVSAVDGVRDAKDSLITGLYQVLVSDDARKTRGNAEDQAETKGSSPYIVKQ